MDDQAKMLALTTKITFTTYDQHQMGCGFVSRALTNGERDKGEYDAHPMFIHVQSESEDADIQKQVVQDCKDLAKLLDKFGIVDDALSDLILLQAGKPAAVRNNKKLHMEYLALGPKWAPAAE